MPEKIFLNFETMPKGTAQQKGECIRYRIMNGKRVPYIHHFKKDSVLNSAEEFKWKLKRFQPDTPSKLPIRLKVIFYYDIKQKKLWNTYKTTRPDADNAVKELIDAMGNFWEDDSQIVDLQVIKRYAEKANIYIEWEEIKEVKI